MRDDKPDALDGISQGDDVEKHTGLRVALHTVDGCHGTPETLFTRTDHHGDGTPLLRLQFLFLGRL